MSYHFNRKLPPLAKHYIFAGPYCLPPAAQKRRVTVSVIKGLVALHFGVPLLEMTSQRRAGAHPRQVAMYLARTRTTQSLPSIGKAFGDRDHTTVIHAVNRVEELRAADPEFDASIRAIEAKL